MVSRQVPKINTQPIEITRSVSTDAATLQFSAYRFGWDTGRFRFCANGPARLVARETSKQQIRLSF
jgi:hypothetical protein